MDYSPRIGSHGDDRLQSIGISAQSAPEVVTGSLRMMGDRILIRPLDWDASSTIVAIRHGRPVRGEVVAVGPGRHPFIRKGKTHDGRNTRVETSKHFLPTQVKVGDIVELGGLNQFDGQGYQFPEIIHNGIKHLIITERDVAGVHSATKA